MLNQGFLCPMKPYTVSTSLDLSSIPTLGDDFVVSQLSKQVNTSRRNELILNAYRQHAVGRKTTLIFATDIAHSQALAELFNVAGIEAIAVTSKTNKDERRAILTRLRDGSLPVVVNCGMDAAHMCTCTRLFGMCVYARLCVFEYNSMKFW
ncbi:hypothetical protein SARC_11763 [Sphaeroforma arctica JP610]|uniref:Uncharacterized protein n=1 Tax=Sphaeroforma arctica JP610 TaxID=667725 RepID=A0A0L0FGX7_9EUKA|nr:hypothetical protein SARC_11763 [Sphaeroforma arctica JP610]KNC75716.1 hypothetical protein SARC_11763 [Sphaeroforma arctica JP610]|eukprot:XP_014149618.1 hypothetical protein SARC_11763 [Sphaeroforma arctica JP610]